MIYYINDSYPDKYLNNNIKKSDAASRRVEYLSDILSKKENIKLVIPMYSVNTKQNLLKSSEVKLSSNIEAIFLTALNIKGLKNIFVVFSLFIFLIKNVTKHDKVLVYNFSIYYAIPIIVSKLFKSFNLIIEYEELYGLKNIHYGLSEKLGFLFGDKFIIASNKIKDKIPDIKKENAFFSAGYINKDIIEIKDNNEAPYLLYTGRIDRDGGIFDLVKIFNESDLSLPLIITGSGGCEEELKSEILKNTNIQFWGRVSNEKLNNLLNGNCICINPINTNMEYSTYSFPSKIIFWLSMGCNVLSTKFNSIKDTGYDELISFYDSHNKESFANGVLEIINSTENKNESKKKIKTNFEQIKNKIELSLIEKI